MATKTGGRARREGVLGDGRPSSCQGQTRLNSASHSKPVKAVAQEQGLPWIASSALAPSTEVESLTQCPSGW